MRDPAHGGFVVTLPWPPTLNHNAMPNGKGGRYLTPKYRAFRESVAWACASVIPLQGRLRATIWASPPDARRRDLDNIVKPVFDSLQRACVIRDDSDIDAFSVVRMAAVKGGKIMVEVRVINDKGEGDGR